MTTNSTTVATTNSTDAAPNNPFFTPWDTPFAIPDFESIEVQHFLPAFERGIAEKRAEVTSFVTSEDAATFANTIEALDAAGQLLDRVGDVFYNMTSAETSDELQAVAESVAPLITALNDDIRLDKELFARIRSLWRARAELSLDTEKAKLLEKTYKSFTRGGANLDATGKKRLRSINEELAVLGLSFSENLRQATNDYRLVVKREADLAGLPETSMAAAREAAEEAGLEGSWLFTLQWPSLWPFLQLADNRGLRREIFGAYTGRCGPGDEHDNTGILARVAALRAEKSQLLGYETWAHFVLEEQMAKTPAAVYELLDQLWKPSSAMAKADADTLKNLIELEGGGHSLQPWDWRYYSDRLRRQKFAVSEDELRPYFPLPRVLEGAFEVARRLYGLEFIERHDLPTYHPEVQTFEVKDSKGAHVGIFLCDYFPRPGKRGGAWSSEFREQHVEDGVRIAPIVVNVGNFSRPTGDRPALLSLDEVTTLFHELGHGLHSLLSDINYRTLGTTPRDFVELPSQLMENWLWEPEVLKIYACHWKTGEVIPDELVAKVAALRTFDQGFGNVEYLAASYLDLEWHTRTSTEEVEAPVEFEKLALARIGVPEEIGVRYRGSYFAHIFAGSGSYSAGYYSYIWSAVLDADAFAAFTENGIFHGPTAKAFRTHVLEPVGADDPMAMYRRFRGREPSVNPLLVRQGLKRAEGS